MSLSSSAAFRSAPHLVVMTAIAAVAGALFITTGASAQPGGLSKIEVSATKSGTATCGAAFDRQILVTNKSAFKFEGEAILRGATTAFSVPKQDAIFVLAKGGVFDCTKSLNAPLKVVAANGKGAALYTKSYTAKQVSYEAFGPKFQVSNLEGYVALSIPNLPGTSNEFGFVCGEHVIVNVHNKLEKSAGVPGPAIKIAVNFAGSPAKDVNYAPGTTTPADLGVLDCAEGAPVIQAKIDGVGAKQAVPVVVTFN